MQEVIIYLTSECPYCLKTKELFEKNGVAFKEIDVQKDEFAWKEMVRKSGQMGVPVIQVNGKIIVGYDESQLRELLKIYR